MILHELTLWTNDRTEASMYSWHTPDHPGPPLWASTPTEAREKLAAHMMVDREDHAMIRKWLRFRMDHWDNVLRCQRIAKQQLQAEQEQQEELT